MPVRVLEHGFAPTVDNFGLEHGVWGDIAPQGQFLLDVEFIMRYSTPTEGASCIYCHTPSYMRDIAAHFPWIHFFGYSSPPVQEDYDPVSPCWSSVMTSEVKGNITTTMTEFTTAVARRLGDDQTAGQNRIFVCHGESMCHQLCLHALLRAQNSFLDVCGVIPVDYVEGEMMLPLYLPNNKIFVSLVTWQHAKCRAYDPVLFQNEIGENTVFWYAYMVKPGSDTRSQKNRFLSRDTASDTVFRRDKQRCNSFGIRQEHASPPRVCSRYCARDTDGDGGPPCAGATSRCC